MGDIAWIIALLKDKFNFKLLKILSVRSRTNVLFLVKVEPVTIYISKQAPVFQVSAVQVF